MSQSTTTQLLPATSYSGLTSYVVTGNSIPAAGYYLGNRNLQTINIKCGGTATTAVTGNIIIQASLQTTPDTDPLSKDWFTAYKLECVGSPAALIEQQNNANANIGVNIPGNFVWIRAQVQDFTSGIIHHIKMTY